MGRPAHSVSWISRVETPPRLRAALRAVLAISAAAAIGLSGLSGASAEPLTTASTQVIVVGTGSINISAAVLGIGGTVLKQLPIIHGVEATIPAQLAWVLAAIPGITVTPNAAVFLADSPTPNRAPAVVYPEASGANRLVAAGDNGNGGSVAVIDTGIDQLPAFAGRLSGGVDLSGEGDAFHDSYGHGTFVAGLIAGNGTTPGDQGFGEAPGAGLVSVKVAGASGLSDLATVIEGVQWTVANQARLGVRVINMSLGVVPTTSTLLNPLDQAVEAAWNSGLVVVTSAGNAGPLNGTILSPGDDPLVITVGAIDDNGTPTTSDDTATAFSSVGPTSPDGWAKPDLVSSGRSVISQRAAGSTIDTANPSARIGTSNFVGSGTSFSSAIVSGAAALVIAEHPQATPNEIKGRLLASTAPGPVGNPFVDGHGALNVLAATNFPAITINQTPVGVLPATLGATVSLASSWTHSTWNPAIWSGSAWNGSAWNGSAWNGSAWN